MHHLKGIFNSILFFLVIWGCTRSPKGHEIHGEAQGTTYTIIISDDYNPINKMEIDSILSNFDQYLSLYNPQSFLTKINDNQSYNFEDTYGYFTECYFLTELLHEQSQGLIDPTLYPILNEWKLYSKEGMVVPIDQGKLKDLKQYVGFNKEDNYTINFDKKMVSVEKKSVAVKFDFNAIAQGYSTDVLANFLDTKGVQNYYIEIGGELVVKGKSPSGKKWRIGIDVPENTSSDDRETQIIVSTTNIGLATSGNYRNFITEGDNVYAHIFNPHTGAPQQSDILSVTVFAPTAGMADGYATYFMLIGREGIRTFCKENKDVSAIIIYSEKGKFKNETIGNPTFVINR